MEAGPSARNIRWSYAIVVLAGIAAWQIYTRTEPSPLIVNAETFSIFAPFYIAAQAIERFLEPLAARWRNTTAEKAELKRARASKERLESPPAGAPAPPVGEIEEAEADVEVAELELANAKAARAIPLWALASILGLLACSALGLGLIAAVSSKAPSSEFVRTVDVLLTGLAVGAGTKPLHDLISRLEKSKENADPTT